MQVIAIYFSINSQYLIRLAVQDAYTVLALANVYLTASPEDGDKQRRYFELAQKMFSSVCQPSISPLPLSTCCFSLV